MSWSYYRFVGGIPLGAHVPQKVRDQIWANDLIDLGTLLPSQDPVEDPWSITVAPNTLTMQSKPLASKSKGPLSFYSWTEAFHIYMAIYLAKYPDEAIHMLKYMSTIKDIFEIKGAQAFRSYDQSFRLLRRTNPLPWQKPIEELFTKAINPKRSNMFNTPYYHRFNNTNRPPFPGIKDRDGTCHQYNLSQCTRRNCIYKHVCKICKGPHPKFKCNRNYKQQQTSSVTSNQTPANPNKR